MKFSYRSLKIVLTAVIAILFCIHSQAQVQVTMHNDTTCRPDTVQVGVSAGNISHIASFDLVFTFDNTILRFDSIFYAIPFFDGYMTAELLDPSTVKLHWDSSLALYQADEALMFKLQFTAIGTGLTALTWDLASSAFTDDSGNPVDKIMTDATVRVSQKTLHYTLAQIMEGCLKEEKGRYAISITSGEPPYEIDWHGGFLNPGNDTIVLGLTGGKHKLTIIDNKGCRYDTTYNVRIKPAPPIRIYTEEEKPYVILQKPDIQFYSNIDSINSVDNSIPNWQWNFGEPDSSRSTEANPMHTFKTAFTVLENGGSSYEVRLWAINNDGCDTTVYKEVDIERPKPVVYNVITPNGDGKNELLTIRGSENPDLEDWFINEFYDRFELMIYDRNGKKIFESNDYKNDWDGGGHADGTYFYVLMCHGRFGDETFQGAVMILTGK